MSSIEIDNISRSFADTKAVDSISFSVNAGELFGVIGPDGAGKTTLFRILTTLLLPDSGSASIAGLNVIKKMKEIRKIVGYMPGRFSLYEDLTVEENLHLFATLFNTTVDENYHLVAPIYSQIEPFKTRKAGKLSGGMKQKLALSCALIHKPSVLFLDEPTTGVDPVSRKEFWEMLKNLRNDGITILVSTPYMDEASLCDRIALIDRGKILSIDTPKNIANSMDAAMLSVKGDHMHKLLIALRECRGVDTAFAFGDCHHATLFPDVSEVSILKQLKEKVDGEIFIERISANVEDIFMDISRRS